MPQFTHSSYHQVTCKTALIISEHVVLVVLLVPLVESMDLCSSSSNSLFQKIYDMDGPLVTQSITHIHPFPLFFTKLCPALLHFCHLTQFLSPRLYVVLYLLILPLSFLIFHNRSLTTNATAYSRLLPSLMLEVVMYWISLLTLLLSVCTILMSHAHAFSDGNSSIVLLFSICLILNSIV